ncbi:peroxidase/cytochrome P450 family protein [Aspergillus mulundensis]|uniref:linoleate 8R-lipoxygenase n=1 Tax=Aspergillus mulundensis TaxID=1810919 RepID=A0A3D8RSH8_9EURO|nr:Psi-producing oxygenase A [Aspergillus mulundensis]RDW76906.1 Psi-producing oxygenase A [Aspergillus mulundensis]
MSSEEGFPTGDGEGARQKWNSVLTRPVEIVKSYVGIRRQVSAAELAGLVRGLSQKGEPLDDKKGTTELLINILTSLPSKSNLRAVFTNRLIETLWNNLQHPPQSYAGSDVKYDVVNPKETLHHRRDTGEPINAIEFTAPDSSVRLREHISPAGNGEHQYRTPDGSFNNILEPNLGKAGSQYAKSVSPLKSLHGVKPDAGLLFDLLMARDETTYRENPAGISSMLFYHASIIIHDIFRTSPADANKSDVSSYLDLAPLYGSSLKDQLEIRTMKEGKLKPDTFHERRLIGQPPGVNVMLVLYSRFHNYVADVLLKINEHGRFTLVFPANASAEDKARAVAKQDHDLFNTARLIVGGLYVNICLHDYLRAITNTHHSKSDWTLDPRVEIGERAGSGGVPRGSGNQVSVEFNLLYRFHSCISKKDERWINNFFLKLFPGRTADDLVNVSHMEVGQALRRYDQSIPKDPSTRTFDGLERQQNGMFRDEDLVRILKEAMDDPAGSFGARMVPKALKIVEVLGIHQARKWQVASLNEFREFFGLKRYERFTEINSNPDIADLLEKLYQDPDMVELYPGLMIEDIKPVRSAGCGICPTYSVGRAVLSDAVTLVRSDRFNTLEFTAANLTNWGYNEVHSDNKTLGGSMLYKLIQRGVPGWFPFNSVAVMQPMYTKAANEQIAREIGTLAQYTLADPKPPAKPVVVFTNAAIKQVLRNPKQFAVPWLHPLSALFPGTKDVSWFMLAGDEPRNHAHRTAFTKVLGQIPNLHRAVHRLVEQVGAELLERKTFTLREGLHQINLIRDVAIPLNARLLGDLFCFDVRSDENPAGTLSAAALYRHLLAIRTWGVNNNDPGEAWNRRRRAQEGAKVVVDSTRKLVDEVVVGRGAEFSFTSAWTLIQYYISMVFLFLFGSFAISSSAGNLSRRAPIRKDSLRSCGYRLVEGLLDQGTSAEQVVDTLWLTAFGGIGVPVTSFYEVLQFFLRPENAPIWTEVQSLARRGEDSTLQSYVLEAQRLTSSQRNVRIATQRTELEGKVIQPGSPVVMMLGEAGRNGAEVPNPNKFDPKRQANGVSAFSYGQHECVAKGVALAFMTGLVKLAAGLKQLRPAAGELGQVKTIHIGTEKAYLDESWSHLGFEVSTWKLQFDGREK